MDWWSIGILVYEMLAGRPPFNNKSRAQLQKQIMAAKLKLPRAPDLPAFLAMRRFHGVICMPLANLRHHSLS